MIISNLGREKPQNTDGEPAHVTRGIKDGNLRGYGRKSQRKTVAWLRRVLHVAECVIMFGSPQQSSDPDVLPVANEVVPAVLRREHPAGLVQPHVLVEVALVVPQGLHLVLLVAHDALVAGVGQRLHSLPGASEDGGVVVEIATVHVGLGPGVPVVGVQGLGQVVVVGVQQSHRVSQRFGAEAAREHLVHVEAEDVRGVVADVRLDDVRDALHPHHGDVLPPVVPLHLDDSGASLRCERDVGHLLRLVREHVVGDR